MQKPDNSFWIKVLIWLLFTALLLTCWMKIQKNEAQTEENAVVEAEKNGTEIKPAPKQVSAYKKPQKQLSLNSFVTEKKDAAVSSVKTQMQKDLSEPAEAVVQPQVMQAEEVIEALGDWIWFGDSRTVGMGKAVGIDCFAKNGAWFSFFEDHYDELVEMSGKTIIFNLGVNDLGDIDKYIQKINNMPDDFFKNNRFVVMAVNPCKGEYSWMNAKIEDFNFRMQTELRYDIFFADTYYYLMEKGFESPDGLHYSAETYKDIYEYVVLLVSP